MERKKYLTEEERKEAKMERDRKWAENHRELALKRSKEYQKTHKKHYNEYQKEYQKEYRKTQIGRANLLAGAYKQSDKELNRGECTITAKWIVKNIFTSKCSYCDKDDWRKLGCDRIDNSKPHTPDNVVCCCEECNTKRGTKPHEEFMKEMQLKMLEKELES